MKTFSLVEDHRLEMLEGSKIDTENALIEGVKMVGLSSPSRNRVYLESALTDAIEMYEGTTANIGHLKPEGSRVKGDTAAIAGNYRNVRMVEGKGLYGDLQLMPSHPMTSRILWAAENAPELFCLSHHAGGKGRMNDEGVQEVTEITAVASVDVVGRGGTTASLFESELEEGELANRVADAALMEKIREINFAAWDLLWERMHEQHTTLDDKKTAIVGVLVEWTQELSLLSTVEESDMDLSKLTISELRESRKDLVELILQESTADAELTTLRATVKELTSKIDAQEAATTAASKIKERETLLESAKIPEILLTEAFKSDVLDINTSDERATALVEDRKALASSIPTTAPKSSAKTLFESAGKGKGDGSEGPKDSKEFVEALAK
jgi:hypothetical protein